MARKKIEPPFTGLGRDPDNKLIVQKSIPLFALWRSGLTLAEFKILDTYLSRIDSHKPDKRAVVFTKGELEQLLGIKQLKPDVLDERLKHLMETTVELDPTGGGKGSKRRIDRITLFERAQAEQDDFGQWTAKLTCTPSAMKYVFNIDHLGYLRYKLRCVTSLVSLYSYILFTYLEHNRFRKEWEVPLDELKATLNCDGEELYREYKRFNERILKKAQKELHEKTECRFSYEAVRNGKTVVAVRFTLETLSDKALGIEVDPNQHTIEEYLDGKWDALAGTDLNEAEAEVSSVPAEELSPIEELFELLSGACNGEFSREEIVELHDAMNALEVFPMSRDSELARVDYLHRKYNSLAVANKRSIDKGKGPIKYRHRYLLTLIKNDQSAEIGGQRYTLD